MRCVHRGHLMFLRPEEESLMSGALIRALTFTGTQAEWIDGVRALKAAGYKQFSVDIRFGQEFDMLQDWSEVFAKI
jgi:5,10-methylenetetrahydromethanopterin reductase